MNIMLTERFDDALLLASCLHRDGIRKGTSIPYGAHLLGLCELVLTSGGDEDEAVAALLHDALRGEGRARAGIRPADRCGRAHARRGHADPRRALGDRRVRGSCSSMAGPSRG